MNAYNAIVCVGMTWLNDCLIESLYEEAIVCLFVCMILFVLVNELLLPDGNVHNCIIVQAFVYLPCDCDVLNWLCLFVSLFVLVRFLFIRLRHDLFHSCGKCNHF